MVRYNNTNELINFCFATVSPMEYDGPHGYEIPMYWDMYIRKLKRSGYKDEFHSTGGLDKACFQKAR